MPGNNIFRTAMLGGYNRQDVNEYVQTMEYEIEAIKKARQEDKRKWEEDKRKWEQSLEEDREQQEKEIPLLKERIAQLERELSRLQKENQYLKDKEREIPEEAVAADGYLDDGLFSYENVKKIMEDAHINADIILKEARQNAEKIVKEAEDEAERQKEVIVSRINAQLDEKGIQLIAAKYKIEQYLKEVYSASHNLQEVYTHMTSVVNSMPTRIDNYWEGDYQKMMKKPYITASENRQITDQSIPEESETEE